MTASELVNRRKQRVAARFGDSAARYEQHADMQRRVAEKLARLLPALEAPHVLEIGCGTGFFTRRLATRYPAGDFTITDISPAMLDACAAFIGPQANIRYEPMDGEAPLAGEAYDLIASSMTVQWFDDPAKGLERLRARLAPGGRLVYSTIGPNLFPEWREVLTELGLPCGVIDMPALPGIVAEASEAMHFTGGMDFLATLRGMGASEPRPFYRQLSAGELRRALRLWEEHFDATASWHVVYGVLDA